ncbi:sensor histidine kinase [Streptomyces sp. URMC 123]|uniref:sensor histidine kinase n=1 Tax=Streptomyces sp. URMC 123 TaxID=3423403 RepID=UPI003F1CE265
MWTPWRVTGEVLLAAVLALLGAGLEALETDSTVRIVVVALLAAVLSLLRRSFPATVLVATAALSPVYPGLAFVLFAAGWSAGRRVSGVGRAAGAFGAAFLLNVGLSFVLEPFFFSPLALVFISLAFLATTVFPGLASRYWSQRRTLLDTLREYNAQLLRERAMIAGQARMRERQRIAQDMHDSLGHQLALIAVHTGALEVDRELTGRQREAVAVLREASVAAMHELREVVGLLRDGTEASPEPVEGAQPASRVVAGIEGLVESSRGAGAAVELRRSGEPRPLAPAADHAAYRIAQEGLTNAHKHAPGAAITVELRYEPDSLVVEIANGPAPAAAVAAGGPVVSGGQGLTGLAERARLVGGMVHAGPTADGGFRLAGVLPYGSEQARSYPGGVDASAAVATAAPSAAAASATFVDATGDFRGQIPTAPLGDGGPVNDWTGRQRELAKAMSRNRTGSGIAIGCGIAALVALLLVVAAGVGLFFLVGEAEEAVVEPKVYESVKVGQPEQEVRDKLPSGDSFMTTGLDKGAPPRPEGAECLSLMSAASGSSWDKEPVFRFCFKDGKLIEKRSYEVQQ